MDACGQAQPGGGDKPACGRAQKNDEKCRGLIASCQPGPQNGGGQGAGNRGNDLDADAVIGKEFLADDPGGGRQQSIAQDQCPQGCPGPQQFLTEVAGRKGPGHEEQTDADDQARVQRSSPDQEQFGPGQRQGHSSSEDEEEPAPAQKRHHFSFRSCWSCPRTFSRSQKNPPPGPRSRARFSRMAPWTELPWFRTVSRAETNPFLISAFSRIGLPGTNAETASKGPSPRGEPINPTVLAPVRGTSSNRPVKSSSSFTRVLMASLSFRRCWHLRAMICLVGGAPHISA